jgi:hypothetical protein
MLRNQLIVQKSREMALHYVTHTREAYSPIEFVKKVAEMESIFLKALKEELES